MKIAIIGGGASGIYLSILLKEKYPNEDINIYEASDKLLTKVKASGNGKCNINNINDDIHCYNNPSFVEPLFAKYPLDKQIQTLNTFGILVKELTPSFLYPYSESATNVRKILLDRAVKIGVKIHLSCPFKSYAINGGRISLTLLDDTTFIVDRLIFASGSDASSRNGCAHLVNEELIRHGYSITTLRSGLAPIRVKENVKSLFGQRVKCLVKAEVNNKKIYEEEGEVLFKKDGLSGIVIFNLASVLSRKNIKNATINLKLLDDELVNNIYTLIQNGNDPLLPFFPKEVCEYIYKKAGTNRDGKKLINVLNKLTFTYDENYPLDVAHVTVGGVSTDDIDNETLKSKIENHVYFVGESLDIDGNCGGFNLKWALVSALVVSDNIKN